MRLGPCFLLLASLVMVPIGSVIANPLDGQVSDGTAAISGQGTANVQIHQTTNKAIINWQTFDIGNGETTQFLQPGKDSVTLNRVTGGLGHSTIDGTLKANGNIFLINPDGILFGANAIVDTGGLVATTSDIADGDFMAGRYKFTKPGNPGASVVNQGHITIGESGIGAFVAPGIRNAGVIIAKLGDIGLAAGNRFSLDFYGDELIKLTVGDEIASQVIDVATGQPLDALVKNEGMLSANGGRVALTATAARAIVDSVINNTGVIEANTVGLKNGRIVLGAKTAATKPAGAPVQKVKVSGTLSAVGNGASELGGKVKMTGEAISVTGATIDASGASGGGTVLIGGDVGGGLPSLLIVPIPKARPETSAVATAMTVIVDQASIIDASATENGDGGKAIIWADGMTDFKGSIAARGGAVSGDGGFAEVSGKNTLAFNGVVDLSAFIGERGTLLLDPVNVTIANSGAGVITPASIVTALATSDLIISTNSSGSDAGDISVESNLMGPASFNLSLNANRDIVFQSGVTWKYTAGIGRLELNADSDRDGSGAVRLLGNSLIDATGGGGAISIFYNPSGGFANPTDFSSHFLGDAGQFEALMLVNNRADLQAINDNLSGSYALGKDVGTGPDIVVGEQATSNVGPFENAFEGTFDGSGYTVKGLRFGTIGADGHVRSLGLIGTEMTSINNGVISDSHTTGGPLVWRNNGSIIRSYSEGEVNCGGQNFCGGIASYNAGTIEQSYATGSVTVEEYSTGGGLVGLNHGTITDSYSTGDITGGQYSIVGGLVGISMGNISNSHSFGSVEVENGIAGGLVGVLGNVTDFEIILSDGPFGLGFEGTLNEGTIVDSSASGAVTGTSWIVPDSSATSFYGRFVLLPIPPGSGGDALVESLRSVEDSGDGEWLEWTSLITNGVDTVGDEVGLVIPAGKYLDPDWLYDPGVSRITFGQTLFDSNAPPAVKPQPSVVMLPKSGYLESIVAKLSEVFYGVFYDEGAAPETTLSHKEQKDIRKYFSTINTVGSGLNAIDSSVLDQYSETYGMTWWSVFKALMDVEEFSRYLRNGEYGEAAKMASKITSLKLIGSTGLGGAVLDADAIGQFAALFVNTPLKQIAEILTAAGFEDQYEAYKAARIELGYKHDDLAAGRIKKDGEIEFSDGYIKYIYLDGNMTESDYSVASPDGRFEPSKALELFETIFEAEQSLSSIEELHGEIFDEFEKNLN